MLCDKSGKTIFKTKEAARYHYGVKSKGMRPKLYVYKCGHCGQYHLTKVSN